jgi:DNA (cytosine-5)-methyltransferase 1
VPTFGSLFAGIGGIDLGLERAGWECRWQVEIDPFCRHVLEHHWPDVPRYGDIRELDWSRVERVDLLAGGFPCQPFSVAGQRRGKDDERWLWPEFAAAVRALRPRHVLVENVPGLLAGHGGMGNVLGDLAQLGYDAEWDSVPAAAVGAPHLRYRVWIVAYWAELRWAMADADVWRPFDEIRPGRDAAGHGGTAGLADTERGGRGRGTSETGRGSERRTAAIGSGAASGRSDYWLAEPDVGRVAHGVPARVDRLRALGNAVVPQVVEVIGRRLLEVERAA